MDKYMDVDPKIIAIAEALMGAGIIYVANDSEGKKKAIAYATAVYLFYGAYLNTQGRVKLLKDKQS